MIYRLQSSGRKALAEVRNGQKTKMEALVYVPEEKDKAMPDAKWSEG
ncbi:MAG: hypothetical protein KI786_18715 [Mameliella sp.]|nr:hypothetical protein [Phaeodactylibacter sp.]NRA51518.1 hypothetical protein [Phaeodactylibacter sp.]